MLKLWSVPCFLSHFPTCCLCFWNTPIWIYIQGWQMREISSRVLCVWQRHPFQGYGLIYIVLSSRFSTITRLKIKILLKERTASINKFRWNFGGILKWSQKCIAFVKMQKGFKNKLQFLSCYSVIHSESFLIFPWVAHWKWICSKKLNEIYSLEEIENILVLGYCFHYLSLYYGIL